MKIALLISIAISLAQALPPPVETPENALKAPVPSAGVCPSTLLYKCQADFNTAIGINGNLDWHVPYDFTYALQNIYQQGAPGIIKVCSAYTAFSQCLGSSYAACTSLGTFVNQEHLDPVTARFYPAEMAQLHFQCGGGLETLLSNWNCIGPGEVNYNATIIGCQIVYHSKINTDPANSCVYAQQLLACVRAPYQSGCGLPASWFMCEFYRSGVATHLYYCNNLRCNVNNQSPSEDENKMMLNQEEGLAKAMKILRKSPRMKVLESISAVAQKKDKAMH